MTIDHLNYLWTWQMFEDHKVCLCMYNWKNRLSIKSNVESQNIKIPRSSYMIFHPSNLLVVDKTNILYSGANQSDLHLILVNGHYRHQLLTTKQAKNEPSSLAMAKKKLTTLCRAYGMVEAFKLIYQ